MTDGKELPAARQKVFLLSPAHGGGRRAQVLLGERAAFPLAVRLREAGLPIGEAFSFMSGLYFRGKLAYGHMFRQHDAGTQALFIITPGRGLVPPETMVSHADLLAIAKVGVNPDEPRFREPLERDVAALASRLSGKDRVVLLGSIATGKYVDVIAPLLAERLCFPADFVGRGDMSRGGLLLRCVAESRELEYLSFAGAVRRGPRPPRLEQMAR